MDYLGPVPKSASGKDMILVAIDRLTKMARFIPTQSSVTSKETADLLLREVFRHHGLPSNIISDRDPRFTAKFWEALQEALGVQLLMSTAAHPQTDGQAEAAVKVIQKLLKPFMFQGQDWEELLPSLEFAYNDTVPTVIYGSDSFLLELRTSPNRCYSARASRQPTRRRSSTILAAFARSRSGRHKRRTTSSAPECG
jgi:transposase InsO family protein